MEELNSAQLVEKWSDPELGKLSVAGIENNKIQESMAQLLENQSKQKEQLQESFNTGLGDANMNAGNVGAHQTIALALQRRSFVELFAHNIVGVQPMSSPVGLAYALRKVYNDGNEAAFDYVPEYSGYSGSISGTSGTVDTGTGVSSTVAEAWRIGTDYPQLSLKMERTAIEAKSRKLGTSYSLETAQDLKSIHNLDIGREMLDILQVETQSELDRELLFKCKTIAEDTAQGGEVLAPIAVNTSASDGRWSQEKFATVVNNIIAVANHLNVTTRRAPGNFVVVSPRIATCLQALSKNGMFSANTAQSNATSSMADIGSLNSGMIKVYRDSYAVSDYALVGYKGATVSDTGVIFSPYLMGVVSEAVDGNSFAPRIGVMSRYAITDSLLGAGRYYRLLKFTGLEDYLIK